MNNSITTKLTPLQQAFLVIRDLENRLKESQRKQDAEDEIAIIGIACHLPGNIHSANDIWEALIAEKQLISDNGLAERWNVLPENDDRVVYHAGLLDDIAGFDNEFFHISPGEAKYMDPQHRQMLMVGYKAFEDAAIPVHTLKGSTTGVFIGIGAMDYSMHITRQQGDVAANPYLGSGNSLSGASGRLSYYFGLNGPSLSIDTACSSSLIAVHQACSSLRNNECNLALVGGVNLLLSKELQQSLTEAGMLAKDGRCKTFNDDANGYVRSEGCIAVVLKRLKDAKQDGDRIYACIKGSAIAQDGASGGLTVPNPEAQGKMILNALKAAGASVDDIDFIEAHGTGTSLGDPVEMQGLKIAFEKRERADKIAISSIKTNLGHLEAAAGIAGFVKATLSLYHRMLPGHLHYSQPNTHIEWNSLPLTINAASRKLTIAEKRLLAGVSSFGFTGAIAHCVLAERPTEISAVDGAVFAEPELIISAPDIVGLKRMRLAYIDYLATTAHTLEDICYTAAKGRSRYKYLLTAKANTKAALAEVLKAAEPFEYEAASLSRFTIMKGRTVDIPGYAFNMEQHWVGQLPGRKKEHAAFAVGWKQLENSISQTGKHAACLFINPNMAASVLKSHLENKGEKLITINCGMLMNELTQQLVEVCDSLGGNTLRIVYDITHVTDSPLYADAYANALTLLNAVQAAAPNSLLIIVAENVSDVYGGVSKMNALQYSLVTFFKSVALEMGSVIVQVADLGTQPSEADLEQVNFANALNNTEYQHLVVCDGYIWYPALQHASMANEAVEIKTGATYLITGGNGSLGSHAAKWLAENGAGKIIITGRSATADTQNIACAIYRQVDIADSKSVNKLKDWLQQEGIVLNGIIHAAGISQRKHVGELSMDDIDAVFASKVSGLDNIASILPVEDLDFLIAYSSIASVWGSAMLSNYAAANAYMDACVVNLRAKGVRATSINWGPWADSSMMTKDADSVSILEATGVFAHTSDMVASQYGYMLNPNAAQLVYVHLNLPKFIPLMEIRHKSAFWNELRPVEKQHQNKLSTSTPNGTRPELNETEINNILEQELRAVLDMDSKKKVSWARSFSEMGIDSILLMRLVKRLNERMQLEITTNMIFNYPTPELLSKHIRKQFFNNDISPSQEMADGISKKIALEIECLDDESLIELIQADVQKYM
jgi:Polyketide synthase modules and related proteins